MTKTQKFLRGIGYDCPSAKVRRRVQARGIAYLEPFKAKHRANLRRAAVRVQARKDAAKLCQGPKQ